MENEEIIETAWFAGLYEGEGCLSQDCRNGLWRLSISMTDKDVIERAAEYIGAKCVGPYKRKDPRHKDMYRTIAYNQVVISEICNKMYPFLGERRKAKIDEAREWLANSKYGFCRKGIHIMNDNRAPDGHCHQCKMDYQREYRARKRMV